MRRARPFLVGGLACLAAALPPGRAAGQSAPAPGTPIETRTYRGLEISVMATERASSAGLGDCPPGTNTQRGMARSGEEFVIVTLRIKVLPAFTSATLDRPSVTGSDGKTYRTAAAFVDVGKQPEYACAFPFRVPQGTQLKAIQVGTLTFDLARARGGAPRP